MQQLTLDLIFLVVFLGALVISANFAVDAISKFSQIIGISELSSGLVIVAVSTSLPETTVSIFSATSGNVGITLGDVFGSNVTNIALIAALLLILSPVKTIEGKSTIVSLSRQLLLVSLIPFLLLVVRADSKLIGIALIAVFAYFVYHTLRTGRQQNGEKAPGSPTRHLVIFFVMISIVIVSSRIVVDSASTLAESTGIRESIIGASIVAMGTSLPELSVDIIAARKGHLNLALGDIIGSCVTNITLVLGIALAISVVNVAFDVLTELISFAIIAPLVMFGFIRRGRVSGWNGVVLLLIYVAFLFVMYETQISLDAIIH